MSQEKSSALLGDFFGGITAGVVALPLALAFGVQSGLGAISGIYGAIIVGFFAALLGGTNTQITGPTGPMTVLSAALISEAIATYGGVNQALPFIILTFTLVGLFQIGLGLMRMGQYIKFIPYPVISGFMSGIGIIIILLQIFPSLGHQSPAEVIQVVTTIASPLHHINWQALSLSLATMLIIYLFPKITKAIPSTLVALVVLSLVANWLHLKVALIGDIPEGLPKFHWEIFSKIDMSTFTAALMPALTIAAVGAIDSLLTSVIADNMTKTSHRSNKELIGQGIGNTLGGIFGGLPSAGATMRTVVNIRSGGKTRLSGLIHSVVLLIVLFGAGKYAELIPLPVLAGILITVGIAIIDYKGFKHLFHVPRPDAGIMLLVAALTVFVNLLHAVAAGIIVACIMFMKKMSDLAEEKNKVLSIKRFQEETRWEDETTISKKLEDKIYIKHLTGPLFFGLTSHFKGLSKSVPDIRVVIIRMKFVPYIDQSGLYAIEEAYEYLGSKGIEVYLTGLQQQPKDMLTNTGIIPNRIPESNVYAEFKDAIHAIEEKFLGE